MIGDTVVMAAEAKSLINEKDYPFKDSKQIADLLVERAGL
jgi:hypothetical protein